METTTVDITASRSLKSRIVHIGQHLLFWFAAMAAMLLLYSRMYDNTAVAAFLLAYLFPVYAASVYVTLYITIPRALLTRRYAKLSLYGAYTVLGVVLLIIMLFLLLLIGRIPFPVPDDYVLPRTATDIVVLSAGVFIVTIAAVALKLLRHWYDAERRSERLQRERLEAELAMLRAQVHPHFLFNTLNNLYALTLKKSDRAPDVVLKLSELLDYMLYESRADTVPVEREARLIEEYLELERLRYGSGQRIEFRSSVERSNPIAPLLFLPLVENSFKHGLSQGGSDAWIRIELHSTAAEIRFTSENSLADGRSRISRDSNGIGLRNVRERLQLLYPGRHEFTVEESAGLFRVSLRIIFPLPTRRSS